jgi:hypothetical protein
MLYILLENFLKKNYAYIMPYQIEQRKGSEKVIKFWFFK